MNDAYVCKVTAFSPSAILFSYTFSQKVSRESCNNRLKGNNHGLFLNEHFAVTRIHEHKDKNPTQTTKNKAGKKNMPQNQHFYFLP